MRRRDALRPDDPGDDTGNDTGGEAMTGEATMGEAIMSEAIMSEAGEKENKRRQLGRGLSALFGDNDGESAYEDPTPARQDQTVPIEFLEPGRYQPRGAIDEEGLADLARSVREKGVLQPLLVRRHPERPERYEIIAGERRWRAAQRAQLHEVPVIIKDFTDQETLEVALVENLQRQDISILDEAVGFRRLMEEFGHTQEALAKAVGKSRSHVANTMRLLALPEGVKALLDGGDLTAGHARALLNATDPEHLAAQVVRQGLNVRETEKLAAAQPGAAARARRQPREKDPDTRALERNVSELLGLKVAIRLAGRGGQLVINYGTLEQLEDVLHRLSHGPADGGAADALDPVAEDEIGPELSGESPGEGEDAAKDLDKKDGEAEALLARIEELIDEVPDDYPGTPSEAEDADEDTPADRD